MDELSVQQRFFQQIKTILPSHLSLVDEVSELLNISNDSAYRRIRAEKPISFDEIQILSSHYKISLDKFLHLQSDSIIFSGRVIDPNVDLYEQHLTNLLENLKFLNGFANKHLYFLTKDIPWINYFQVPGLATFKIFLWLKTILHYDTLKGKQFSMKYEFQRDYLDLGKKICQQFNKIPATEIWNLEGINVTLDQIEYYRQCDLFKDTTDIPVLYNAVEELISHIERQAELGKRFPFNEMPSPDSPEFNMFYSEIALGDNTVLVDLDKVKVTFLNHSVIDFISTSDERFNNSMFRSLKNLISKSTQISIVGEKDRARFFGNLRAKIQQYKRRV